MGDTASTTGVLGGIVAWLQGLPAPLAVVVSGLLPGFEPRYAVVLGVILGLPLTESIVLAMGTVIVLAFLLTYLIGLIDGFLPRLPRVGRLYESYRARASSKARGYIERYGLIGLVIFVAIPLPATGMYTGAVAGLLLGIRGRKLLTALLAGGIVSVILTTATVALGLSMQIPW